MEEQEQVRENESVDTLKVKEETEVTEDKKQEEKPVNTKAIVREIILYLMIAIICIFIVPRYVIQRTDVKGASMENTLQDGNSLLVQKVTYYFKDPDRFDVIVFYPYGRDIDEYYVKRVIGLPGEKVQIKGEDIYINDELLEEDYGKMPITDAGIAENGIVLGEDEYFVMGDNREVSMDSRDDAVGPVKRSNIEGKVAFRIWPLNEFGFIN